MSTTYYLANNETKLLYEIGPLWVGGLDRETIEKIGETFRTFEAFKAEVYARDEIETPDGEPFFSEGHLRGIYDFAVGCSKGVLVEQDAWERMTTYGFGFATGCPRCGLTSGKCGLDLDHHGVLEIEVSPFEHPELGSYGRAKLPTAGLFFRFPGDVILLAKKDTSLDLHSFSITDHLGSIDILTTVPPEGATLLLCGKFAGDAPDEGVVDYAQCGKKPEERVQSVWKDDYVPGALRKASHKALIDKYGEGWLDQFEYFPKRRTPRH